MKTRTVKFKTTLIALAIAGLTSTPVLADEHSEQPPPFMQNLPEHYRMYINLGAAGLLTELANVENISVTQGRLGVSRAQSELSRATGIVNGFKDTTKAKVLPMDLITPVAKSGGRKFFRAGLIYGDYDGQKGDLVEVDTQLKRVELQYFVSPNINSLYGIGPYYEKSEMRLVHLNGTIDRPGYGLRADALNKLSSHWGLASRLDYNIATSENSIPVGPGTALTYDLDEMRLYFQSDLVGTYNKQSLDFLPNNWIFRPAIGLVYQHTDYDKASTNLGSTVTGTAGRNEDYAFVSFSARLESTAIGPKIIAPHIELGIERELKNELDTLLDDPTIFHLDIGASMNISRSTRLDLLYTRHDGSEDLRKDQAIVLHVGVAF